MSQNLLSQIFSLSAELVETSCAQGKTIATAESCTGGLIGAAITATPGSSAVFYGGIIAYHNSVKVDQLGVGSETIETYGAVSESVAAEMAAGCRAKLKVDIAVSITGVAGPGGGSVDKPVGTVWIGLATATELTSKRHDFPDVSRNKVRDYTCLAALETIMGALR